MELVMFVDPIEGLHGPLRPAYLLARELRGSYNVTFVTPSSETAEEIRSAGLEAVSFDRRYFLRGSLRTLEAWLRSMRFNVDNDDAVVVNFSQAFLVDADIYYAQGPITRALDDMYPEMRPLYRAIYRAFRRLFILHDRKFNRGLRRASRLFIANSSFTRSMYEAWGIRVDGVIHPPLDTSFFRPITSRPSGDYVLTYVGKETEFSAIRRVADAGVKIRAFGSKISHVPDYIRGHPNIELLGRVSDEELVELYSNALFTLFPFTHEPFGYVPVESMACGTPVLTYAAQGPGETVIHGVTGWLAKDEDSLVNMAVRIWREGYPSDMRARSRERAEQFDAKVIADRWLDVLKGVKG